MERDRGFNFKLVVPPRASKGQISAVRPQEIHERCGDFVSTLDQGYSKCFNKEQSVNFVNTSMVAPTKPTLQDFPMMKAVPPMEKDEKNCTPGQLYTKLFDEVEKIKSWKIKVDFDTLQKERRLQENKRTIETQRKAIQELQFGNENLSIKLEEQISENEDLRNKNNATRNLCNILKDTFERSAEKMHLFESEREETQHTFMENSAGIQKLIAAFESLRIQVEADQQEMHQVKEGLQQFEILKEKFTEEYDMKEKEVAVLRTKLEEKKNELQKILLDLHETQQHCKLLEGTTNEQHELLKRSEAGKKSLLQQLQSVEKHLKETDAKCKAIAAQLEQSKEEYEEIIRSKDISLQELSREKAQQAAKLEQIQTTIQEIESSLAMEIQKVKELEGELVSNKKELEETSALLGETMDQSEKKDGQIKSLEDELNKQSKSVESMQDKLAITEDKVEDLEAELSRKNKEAQLFKDKADVASTENDLLKRTCEASKKEQEDITEKSAAIGIKVQELEQQLFSEIKKNKEHTCQMEQLRKDITQHEKEYQELLFNFIGLQSEKKMIQQQFESGSANVKAIEENLEKEIKEKFEYLQEEITEREKQIKAVETKLVHLRKKLEIKLRANEEFQKENKVLKKQIAKETAKSHELENVINNLYEESQNLKQLNAKDRQQLLKDLESKSTFAAELENEVQKLRGTTKEAIKNKEDAELKCQQKITDMVTLMEKHKGQYDRMVEEKDAELVENKKRDMEAVAQRKSLELDLLKEKAENDQLKQQLNTEESEKANLQKKLTDLKREMSLMKIRVLSEARNNQSAALNYTQGKNAETPKESFSKRQMFDFSKCRFTPSQSKVKGSTALMKVDNKESEAESVRTPCGTTQKIQESQNGDFMTPQSTLNRVGGTSKIKVIMFGVFVVVCLFLDFARGIKIFITLADIYSFFQSYRIKTPPSAEKAACWKKNAIELDPKSDSSSLNDLLVFASVPEPNLSASSCNLNILKKIQSPVPYKSPGNSLKLAAMKRMRDAGWTAVTGNDKKKKKTKEKIFA
ncbi:synaptonemal complex protein 1 [Cheilinus undulatus]|uniref:synaptonemal complex protein 1 n=1 Tax=Cheilinus undulatus TaxID=241271 RepID=UPI001BD41726|nr:synaptonemal complex protein 1 [Cheilinus undulatus]